MACNNIKFAYKLIFQSNILNKSPVNNLTRLCKYSSYQNSKKVDEFEPSVTKYEVSKDLNEWQFVERLIPPLTVPKPVPKNNYNTDWKPPRATFGEHKYYINRNRNHLLPIYLTTTHRGMRKITEVCKIHGDIYAMDKDLKEIIKKNMGYSVASQINELVGCIKFKGDYVKFVKEYLMSKGF